jgi:hypothetical protein
MAHDFFTEQPVIGAEIYFLKAILHDWSDLYAAKILQKIASAMKTGSRIVIVETVVPPNYAAPLPVAKMVSALDLQMLAMCSSKERTGEEWAGLVKKADERLTVTNITLPPGSPFALIEVGFDG